MRELGFAQDEELSLLLALNREKGITPAQLERLDFLLEQRGRQIEAHRQILHYQSKYAA